MGAAARALAIERYAWSDIARRLEGIYERAVATEAAARRVNRLVALVHNPWARGIFVLASLAAALLAIWWRGPDWPTVYHAFDFVSWRWVIVGVLLNLLSVLARSLSWRLTIDQALPEPHPRFGQVFSAFGIGLLGNAVLPARAGELARVAVLRRHLPHGKGTSATLLGTVFAHRLFDLFPVAILVTWVLLTAKIPHWAVTSLVIFGVVGFVLLTVGLVFAGTGQGRVHDGMGSLGALVTMARQGLAVLRAPVPALGAALFQCVGWLMQLFAVWAVMEAFDLDLPLPAAGLVLVLMNVATIFPLWPGNIGLLQAAVALPLVQYGVPYGTGFAYGLVLQAVEMSVGVGVGLIFLAREGLSLASLKTMEEEQESEENALHRCADELADRAGARPGRVSCAAQPPQSLAMPGSNAPRRAAITSSAVAVAGSCPVTAATNSSRSSARSVTSVAAVTVAVRGTSRRSAISPNPDAATEPLAGHVDLAGRDHVVAVAGLALPHDLRPGREPTARRETRRATRASRRGAPRAGRCRAGARGARAPRCAGRSTAAGRSPRARARAAAGPVRISAHLMPGDVDQQRREQAADADRADQDALEHAEHAGQHVVRHRSLHDREGVDVDDRVTEPDEREREQRHGHRRRDPDQDQRQSEQPDPDPEIGGEPPAGREDECDEAADEAADPERGVEVADPRVVDTEQLERADDDENGERARDERLRGVEAREHEEIAARRRAP